MRNMGKDRFEVRTGGKEIFKDNKYEKHTILKDIISDNQKVLDNLLSIKIAASNDDRIRQYNIETKKFITNMTTHNGLDLFLTQHNKKEKTDEVYTPYSNPGYSIFTHLLLAYHELHKKRPHINRSSLDIEGWNKQARFDIPLKNFVDNIRWNGNLFEYINYKDFWKEDSKGITRLVSPREDELENTNREGFGIQGDDTIIRFGNYGYENAKIASIIIENELIPLYLQAFLDVNMSVSGPRNATNLKKIYEMIFYVLESKENNKEELINNARRNTSI